MSGSKVCCDCGTELCAHSTGACNSRGEYFCDVCCITRQLERELADLRRRNEILERLLETVHGQQAQTAALLDELEAAA